MRDGRYSGYLAKRRSRTVKGKHLLLSLFAYQINFRKLQALSRISQMATFLVSFFINSISKMISNSFHQSKYRSIECNDFFFRDVISHRVKNFEKLEPTFRNLHVKFDSNLVDKIMKGERGCALRLLY